MSWGTTREFEESFENMMGTHWEQEEKPKKMNIVPNNRSLKSKIWQDSNF